MEKERSSLIITMVRIARDHSVFVKGSDWNSRCIECQRHLGSLLQKLLKNHFEFCSETVRPSRDSTYPTLFDTLLAPSLLGLSKLDRKRSNPAELQYNLLMV